MDNQLWFRIKVKSRRAQVIYDLGAHLGMHDAFEVDM